MKTNYHGLFVCAPCLTDKDDKMNADALLQVSVSANHELYEKIRSERIMCEALRELMKDEIDKTVNEAIYEAVVKNTEKNGKDFAINMLKGNEPISKITKYTSMSKEKVLELAKQNGISVVQ